MVTYDFTKRMIKQYEKQIRDYVLKHTGTVLKEPRSYIRYPFIDPGSVYDGNIWDWDTYWTVYGLLGLMEYYDEGTRERILESAKGNVRNFMDHQLKDGYIPMMIEAREQEEMPYLNRKHQEGVLMNMHKPFLCGQICLISDYTGDYSWAEGFYRQLIRYFECYDQYYYIDNCGLYAWCDDIMIGMDNDPASFGRPKFSTANIFLNSFMSAELRAMAKYLEALSRDGSSYREKARKLEESINRECWDQRDRFFYSVDVDIKTRSYDWFHQGLGVFWKTLPIKIRTWSGFLPMWAGFASQDQAKELVKHIFDKDTFYSDYGITTLAKDEKMFSLAATNNPSNWLGGIWLVANYTVFRGLLNYGCRREAKLLCENSLRLIGRDLEQSGSMHEYYDPFTGRPVMNGGFLNWNILVLNMVRELEEGK